MTRRILEHYLSRAAPEAATWNLSPECAYIDYRFRRWMRELLPVSGMALNVGIGVGEWDDFLGYQLASACSLTSLDVDPEICAVFQERQRLEGHVNPSRVVCDDIGSFRSEQSFDLITVVGSTLQNTGDAAATVASCAANLRVGGLLVLMGAGVEPPTAPIGTLSLRRREADRALPKLPLYLCILSRAATT